MQNRSVRLLISLHTCFPVPGGIQSFHIIVTFFNYNEGEFKMRCSRKGERRTPASRPSCEGRACSEQEGAVGCEEGALGREGTVYGLIIFDMLYMVCSSLTL